MRRQLRVCVSSITLLYADKLLLLNGSDFRELSSSYSLHPVAPDISATFSHLCS